MKFLAAIREKLKGITSAFERYPLTVVFLTAAAVIISVQINTDKDYFKYLLTFVFGAALSIVLQAAFERFFVKLSARLALMGIGIVLASGYYLIINTTPELNMEISVRTSVAVFALFIAFIWVPVIKSRISFDESFMAAFKAFFQSLFFAAVLFAGCAIIFGAIDTLIYDLDSKIYGHTANIVFVLFGPILFLSLIPPYPGKREDRPNQQAVETQDEAIRKASQCPKFLEVLISYIIIPLAAVFTVILIIYIMINILGEFWSKSLLEPMLVSYAVAIILLTILSSGIENKMARLSRSVFPKILIPIVLFQIAASILKLGDTGLTHTRYFVILFGLFAVSAGVVLNMGSVRKHGIVAAMLIGFACISIVPPVDAFTLSRISQTTVLRSVLTKNNMLSDDAVTPNPSISDADKEKITISVEYLSYMGYTDKISYLPEGFALYDDFYDTFGFYEFNLPQSENRSVNVVLDPAVALDIQGYESFAQAYVNFGTDSDDTDLAICDIGRDGKLYRLIKEKSGEQYNIVLLDEGNRVLISFTAGDIFTRYSTYTMYKSEISGEEATFTTENDAVKLTVVVRNANMNLSDIQQYYYADLFILVKFK